MKQAVKRSFVCRVQLLPAAEKLAFREVNSGQSWPSNCPQAYKGRWTSKQGCTMCQGVLFKLHKTRKGHLPPD